jgi:SpoIID/LytB domain protein
VPLRSKRNISRSLSITTRRTLSRLAVLISLFAVFAPVPGLRAEFTAADRVKALYSPMFAFNAENVPVVRVGLGTGFDEVRVHCHGPVRLYTAERGGLEWRSTTARTITTRRISGTAARVVFHVGVERLKPGNFDVLRTRIGAWEATGHPVKAVERGRVFGHYGKMFDNRSVELLIDHPFDRREEAKALVDELRQADPGGAEPFVSSSLLEMPSGEMEVSVKGLPGHFRSSSVVRIEPLDDAGITVYGVEYGVGFSWHRREDLRFDGEVYVTFDRNGTLAVVNRVDAETLLKGVVAGEIYASAPSAALKAQAVTARTDILSKIGLRHNADPFHICADVHCQVHKGASKRTPGIDKAVDTTQGQMLFSGGELVPAYYHSDSGGFTEANENAWLGQDPNPSTRCAVDMPTPPAAFADGVPADEAKIAAYIDHPPKTWSSELRWAKNTFRWKRRVARKGITAALARDHGATVGAGLDSLQIVRRGCSGRVIEMRFIVSGQPITVRGELTLRRLLGGGKALKSSLFIFEDQGTTLEFRGGGFGHGVGMSQMGAIGRAKAGQLYDKILRAYYKDASVEKVY